MLLHVEHRLAIGQTTRIPGRMLSSLSPGTQRIGRILTIRDQRGQDFRVRVVSIHADHCEALVFEASGASVESPVAIHLLQGLPKKEKLEWILQKVTELGVYSIVPFESEKSITLEQRDARQKKSHRWQRVATKAVQQCRRARIPQVYPPLAFSHALELFQGCDLRLLLWEREADRGLRAILTPLGQKPRNVALVVGPEGGFSSRELYVARRKGYTPISLGQRILRTETAAIAATAIVQYELGDLSGRG